MFSRFFIERPILAAVLAILIVIAGAVALFLLPVAQYPQITPPVVQVTAQYPGADPRVVAQTVAVPIEQVVNGVDNMLYMSSTSASDGSYTLRVTFELGTDPDMDTVLVQNRVAQALPRLPLEVQRLGVTAKKSSTELVTVLSLYSPTNQYDQLYIANYVTLRLLDEINRINGVGDSRSLPSMDYSMRIWLDPDKLEYRNMTTTDVVDAISQQNVQVAAGRLGQEPAPPGQDYQLTIYTLGRLSDVSQFENIILRSDPDGRITRVKDVARVQLGAQAYDTFSTMNGQVASTIIIYQSPGSNALTVADNVLVRMEQLKKQFPPGLEYRVVYQISDFVRASIHEVVVTLGVAFVLVFLVVYIFLQDWRATLIPTITIPVSLIGAFAAMLALDFSINMVTLFGLVLAIGIVVDDAIVVVENVERNMREHHLPARQAAIRAMQEVTGAIVGITLVLMAVFLPAALLPGITGQLYRQFSLTIAVTTLLSAFNALTLSPALCALFLRVHRKARNPVFRIFNWGFDRLSRGYGRVVAIAVRRVGLMLVLFAVLLATTYLGYRQVPTGFIPDEDDGLVVLNLQLPDGASLQRTRDALTKIGRTMQATDGVQAVTTIGGFSIIDGPGANLAAGFAALQPWDERIPRGRTKPAIVAELAGKFARVQEGIATPISLPPIRGLGTGSGFEMFVQDRTNLGLPALQQAIEALAQQANRQPALRSVFATFRAAIPAIFLDIDRTQVYQMGVPLAAVFATIQAYLGSTYVNDFNKFGRTWQVKVQADSYFRSKPDQIPRLRVRNNQGAMVPFGSFSKVRESLGPVRVDQYNLYPAARISGQPSPGTSTGQTLTLLQQLADQVLPAGMSFEWTGMSYQEIRVGYQGAIAFGMAILVIFLILAGLYESWIDPLAVILVVPLAALGAVAALLARQMENNLYTQVGLVLLVGLAAKNAILIVEFARDQRRTGQPVLEAAITGSRIRFRPILMTSFAFILGVFPLVIARGAGANSRQSLGTAVFGGMLTVTILGVFFTPVLYVALQYLRRSRRHGGQEPGGGPPPSPPDDMAGM